MVPPVRSARTSRAFQTPANLSQLWWHVVVGRCRSARLPHYEEGFYRPLAGTTGFTYPWVYRSLLMLSSVIHRGSWDW